MTSAVASTGIPQPEIQERLDRLLSDIRSAAQQQIGYPTNQNFDYSPLLPFLAYSINNVGDPFHTSNYWANTHEIEREVITRFADLMRIAPADAWGYVTSGGTEGNMYGLYLARELFPNAMFYFSEETHYSVLKNVRVLNARYIMIKRQENGEIDYDDLYEMIRVNRDVPAVIMANIGTTMRGAVDNIDRIRGILSDLAVTSSYIHADAALSGLILPFVADPQPFGFDAGIDSICKFSGVVGQFAGQLGNWLFGKSLFASRYLTGYQQTVTLPPQRAALTARRFTRRVLHHSKTHGGPMTTKINCDIDIIIDDDNKGRYSAYAEVTGMTVYADTEEEVIYKIYDAIRFFFQTIIEQDGDTGLTDYLDRRNTPYDRIEIERAPASPRRVKEKVEVYA